MAAKKGKKTSFCKNWKMTLSIPSGNLAEINLSGTVSEINTFLYFMQKFKMATKKARSMILCTPSSPKMVGKNCR